MSLFDHWPEPDLLKPNHYAWDSLGDPYNCDEDHNHPPRVPSEFMRRLARLFLCFAVGGACAVIFLVVYALAEMVF